jgi:hypothetical protein
MGKKMQRKMRLKLQLDWPMLTISSCRSLMDTKRMLVTGARFYLEVSR